MKNTERLTDRDWEKLASSLSGENTEQQTGQVRKFLSEDRDKTTEHWKALGTMNDDREINVDSAWNKVHARLSETGTFVHTKKSGVIFMRSTFMKVAAAAIIFVCLGAVAAYLNNKGIFSKEILLAAGNDEKNVKFDLPDGSVIHLNRNTELKYRGNMGTVTRNVRLRGEAYFEIASDPERPFIIDAGKAKVRVTGTSFNVISNNTEQAVEVFVNSGQVVLTNNSGTRNIILDPGYIGTMDSDISGKKLNDNPNYMAWKTDMLVYNGDGQRLEVVFNDLKRAYNMDIIADNPEIPGLILVTTGPINNENQETIIKVICASFNLSYSKDGNIYHLAKK